ncbi:MAG TPA: IS1 family transposase [Desulfobacterales bacterium]|nr:IS1 family transposase [Desulfobacterales bacterium]
MVFETLKQRGHPHKPPPTVSDGWGGIREAMVEVYGQVPDYSGQGRPPTLKQPGEDWQYLQVVKQRENGRVTGTKLRVIYGDPKEVLALLGKSTSYIERSHLTSRHFNSRQVRKTLAFSKALTMHKAAATLEDGYYNLIRPHKSLRIELNQSEKRWKPRTPALAAGLTDHIWTVKELFLTIPVPSVGNT